jgi:hypothetical protein
MKKLLLLLLLPVFSIAQECVKVDTVYVSAKVRELKTKDVLFGIKQIAEEELQANFCLSETGGPIMIEVYYFGLPKSTFRIAGVERSNTTTQVGIRLFYNGVKYEGIGESDVEVRAMLVELTDGIPFSKMTVSSSIKKAISECILKMPK